jgi:hypothetical protein
MPAFWFNSFVFIYQQKVRVSVVPAYVAGEERK